MSGDIDRRRFLLLACAVALGTPAVVSTAASPAQIPLATDLGADGRLSRSRKAPIVILFSLPGCPYCEIVRRSHLGPMLRDPRQGERVIIRQIDVGSDQGLVGFRGERTTHAAIAGRDDHAACTCWIPDRRNCEASVTPTPAP